MANYYVKKIENTSEYSEVNSKTSSVSGGSILKTNSQVGVFKNSGTNFYTSSGLLDGSKGFVSGQQGVTDNSNYIPSRDSIESSLRNSTVKSVFKKFFTNTSGDDHTTAQNTGVNGWESSTNLNAFAYMRANLGVFNEIGSDNLVK